MESGVHGNSNNGLAYWLADIASRSYYAGNICIVFGGTNSTSDYSIAWFGVRPVIEISKSNL